MEIDTDLLIKFTSTVSKLDATLSSIAARQQEHEIRIQKLEENKTGFGNSGFGNSGLKNDVIAWLVKGLVASIFVIGSLTGASAIIQKVFGL